MANRITFDIGYQIDKSTLEDMKASLLQLQGITAGNLMDLNRGMNLTQAQNSVRQLKADAQQLQGILTRSFNADLGTLNVVKFNNELKKLDLNSIYGSFSLAGNAGKTAFRDITTQALTTNMQLKETHHLLDDMATSMKNTIKWTLSSSALNTFTGSVKQAYGFIKNLDRSLNDIRIVTNKSAEDMANFAVQANKAAQTLGASTLDYTSASLIYAQQGKL